MIYGSSGGNGNNLGAAIQLFQKWLGSSPSATAGGTPGTAGGAPTMAPLDPNTPITPLPQGDSVTVPRADGPLASLAPASTPDLAKQGSIIGPDAANNGGAAASGILSLCA